jgi:hypothetical protein
MSNCPKEKDCCPINKLFDTDIKCPYKNITKNVISHGIFVFFIFKLIKKVMNNNTNIVNETDKTDNIIELFNTIPNINNIFDLSNISGNLNTFSENLNSCPINLNSCPILPRKNNINHNIKGNIGDNISKLLSPNNINEITSLLEMGGMGSIGSLAGLFIKNLSKESIKIKPIVPKELTCIKSKTKLFPLLAKTILVIFSFIIIKIILDIIFDMDDIGLQVEMDFGNIEKNRNKKKI